MPDPPEHEQSMYHEHDVHNNTQTEKRGWMHWLLRCSPYCWYTCIWSMAVTELNNKWGKQRTDYINMHPDWRYAHTSDNSFVKAHIHNNDSALSSAWLAEQRAEVADVRHIGVDTCETCEVYCCPSCAYAQVYDEVTSRENYCGCCC